MSKLSNAILMLSYLQNGKKYSITELSERLEVTPRMIRTYKEDLEKSGFIIDTIYGPYGGYIMRRSNLQISPCFNDYDIKMISDLKESKISKEQKEYLSVLLDRIKLTLNKDTDEIFTKEVRQTYNVISKAIKTRSKVKITYDSLGKGLNERIIHPLEIFSYKDNFAVAAFCETKKDLRHFEFKRIKKLKILKENY